MRVTLDAQHDMAYISLTDDPETKATETVSLHEWADEAGVQTMHDLTLDLDAKGRLIGIEVGRAQHALPNDLIAKAERL